MTADNIELPPLPPMGGLAQLSTWIDEIRIAAVLADRERRAKPAQPARPKVHSARVYVTKNGYAWLTTQTESCPIVTLCWTDDGRTWINSERNRELAMALRYWTIDDKFATLDKAADALDGGVR